MFPLSFFITPLSIFLSLSTATGVFVHDTRIDKVTATVLTSAKVAAPHVGQIQIVNFATDLHTHAEPGSTKKAASSMQSPQMQPRANQKKYVSQKNADLGHETIGGYMHPVN